MQHHNPEEQNPNDFTASISILPNTYYFCMHYYIFLPTGDTGNSESWSCSSPNTRFTKVQQPYFSKM